MFGQVADWSVAMLNAILAPIVRHAKLLVAVAALSVLAPPLHAQKNAVLVGIVRSDSAPTPLLDAEVYIPALRIGRHTDSSGFFRMENIKPGEYDVIVRRLGFTPKVTRMKFEFDETTAQQFELSPVPNVLAVVAVRAPDTARSLYVDNITRFEQRRSHGFGMFITGDELQAAKERRLSTVLHTIPAVRLFRSSMGMMIVGSEQSGRKCASQIYLDGVKVSYALDINSISPASLRGIEYYAATSNAPGEFEASPGFCGVLVLWTRVLND